MPCSFRYSSIISRLRARSICRRKSFEALRFARAGDWAVWGGAGGRSAVGNRAFGCWVDLAAGEGSNIWDLSRGEGAGSLATSWALAILLVGRKVEGDEKEQVRAENAHARERSELLTSALSSIWHPWEVGGCEVGVGSEVDED